jgi:hypothetical protein
MSNYLTIKPWLKMRLEECMQSLKDYIAKIEAVEKDTETPENERLLQIKKIRAEIDKVGTEIDSIKKEIMILNKYSLN